MIYGGEGNDTFWFWSGKGYSLVYGEAGNDTFQGISTNDVVHGGAGNDMFYVVDLWTQNVMGVNDDFTLIDGGLGTDSISLPGSTTST